ncbi:AraC family transcriptional regulator [Brachybacterium hainanense]|uniref:DUF6597 domain-containing transcriptional factor n=1 Tax=Brachybacterium hainanense TaxID=1541174 RepID=A0ABV6R8K9_9MICO
MDARTDWRKATASHMYGHVLRPEELVTRARYGFAEPAPELRRWVERYWSVRWSLAEDEVFPVSTLDDPAINLTVERGDVSRAGTDGAGVWITGPVTRGRFDVVLRGEGSVLGIKFQLGGAAAFLPRNASPVDLVGIRDATIPAADWFGADLPDPAPDAADAERDAPALDAWLRSRGPEDPPGFSELHRVLALLEDPEVTGPAVLESRSGLSIRSLQRLFARQLGIGPKRMILRARVMDAVEAIDLGEAGDLTGLAHRLGWFDQSHLIRDFRALTGLTPSRYARRPRGTTLGP